ncbi:response regulator SirA, partial [Salmonella enterica subsp. enterica serovar Typhimurium]|nr:response regulator SirA [Salmonella enterica subsp. enterica serovar Typhimurium]
MINQHPIFLGGERKTFDSLNKHYPKIFELYKQQKAQDWSED